MVSGPERWTAVDRYLADLLIGPDEGLDGALAAADAAGLPNIAVSPAEGKLLHLLAKLCGARRVLEVGTLAGYSTIWLARALPPGGRVVTLECEPRHAEVAAANFARAGVAAAIDLRVGRAIELLPRLEAERSGPFDLTFIDADKPSTPDYFQWAVRLSRPGSVIVVDNVVREGEVINPASHDNGVAGTRKFLESAANDRRVTLTAVQTVGIKGYDGFAIAVVQ